MANPRHAVAEPRPAQRDVEEEPERRAGQVHARIARAERGEVELVAPQVLRLGPVRRDPQEGRELPDLTDVITLGMLAELPDRHVFDHATAQRADGFGAHGELLSETG